jgi:hypothetical protein
VLPLAAPCCPSPPPPRRSLAARPCVRAYRHMYHVRAHLPTDPSRHLSQFRVKIRVSIRVSIRVYKEFLSEPLRVRVSATRTHASGPAGPFPAAPPRPARPRLRGAGSRGAAYGSGPARRLEHALHRPGAAGRGASDGLEVRALYGGSAGRLTAAARAGSTAAARAGSTAAARAGSPIRPPSSLPPAAPAPGRERER